MSNKNVITNLTIKQMAESSAMGFNKDYIARSSDVNFIVRFVITFLLLISYYLNKSSKPPDNPA